MALLHALGAGTPPSWKNSLSEGWLNKMLAHVQNGSCQTSAKGGGGRATVREELCPSSWPLENIGPYMAGNPVRVEAVRMI